MPHQRARLLTSVALLSLALPSSALAQGYLGSNLTPFAVLAGTTVTCTGASTITGNVGVSPGSAITGFPAPCTDVGTLVTPPTSNSAQLALTTVYNTLAALPCAATVGPNLTGLTLTQGVYCVGAAASNLTGTLVLDAQGNSSAVFVFEMSSTLITSPGSTVSLINDARETDGVRSRDAQLKTAVVRSVRGDQAAQFRKVWLAGPANSGTQWEGSEFSIRFHTLESTLLIRTIASFWNRGEFRATRPKLRLSPPTRQQPTKCSSVRQTLRKSSQD